MKVKGIDFGLVSKLIKLLKDYPFLLFFAFLLMLLNTVSAPLRPYLSKIAIDDYILKKNFDGLVEIILLIGLILVLSAFFQFTSSYLMRLIGQKSLYKLRLQLFNHLLKFDVSFFDKTPIGRIVTRLTNDIETISDIVSGGLMMILIDLLLIVSIIVFMFITDVRLTFVTLGAIPVFFTISFIFKNKVRVLFTNIRKVIAQINSFLNEYFSGITTIKLFDATGFFQDKFRNLNLENRNLWLKTISYYAIFFPTIELIGTLVLSLILWYTAVKITSNEISLGTFFAFIQFAEMFFRPIRDLTEKFTTLQNAITASEQVFKILEEKPRQMQATNGLSFEKINQKIVFDRVSFSYDNEKFVLKGISFEINRGETVAIIGPTGSGKTTLVHLLCRFYTPNEGRILIDGIEINRFRLQSYLQRIAIVSQDVFLFSRTIFENITLGDESLSIEEVERICQQLGIDQFIKSLPRKYFTSTVDKGFSLSAGQRQLLSFIRAFIRNPELLILDEATSNIDPESEKLIENLIQRILKNRTSVVVAHRISTILNSDKIIVLKNGEIAEIGTHQDLLQSSKLYSKLFEYEFVR